MHHTDQRAHHVSHGVTLADDEPIEPSPGPEALIEVARLSHRIGADERLAHHEDLIGLRQLAKLLERGHESLVVVPTSRGVDQNDIEVGF